MLIPNLLELASKTPLIEVCGGVIDGVIHPSANLSEDPTKSFKLDTKTSDAIAIALYEEKDVYLYHSHPEGLLTDFSILDIQSLDKKGVKGILLLPSLRKALFYDPSVIQPYINRDYHLAYQNCFTLVRDYYKQELGIILPRYYRKEDLSLELVEREGFRKVDILKVESHDLIVSNIGGELHLGVMTDNVKNLYLHHPFNQRSILEPLNQKLRKRIIAVFRYDKN